jgi:hypothetical protein
MTCQYVEIFMEGIVYRLFIVHEIIIVIMLKEVWTARIPAGYFDVILGVQYSLP